MGTIIFYKGNQFIDASPNLIYFMNKGISHQSKLLEGLSKSRLKNYIKADRIHYTLRHFNYATLQKFW